MKFKFEKLETTFNHGGGKSEPAIFVSMAGCIGSECLEVNEWIAKCEIENELIEEFKKEAKRFILNKDNWLKHGDFRNGEFKPFEQRMATPKEPEFLAESSIPGGSVSNDKGNLPRLKIVSNEGRLDKEGDL